MSDIEGVQFYGNPIYSPPSSDNLSELNRLLNKSVEGTIKLIKDYTNKVNKKIKEKEYTTIPRTLSDERIKELQDKISNLVKYYNELHQIFINIYNEENNFSGEIKLIVPDAIITKQDNYVFQEYKIDVNTLNIEELLYLANKLLIYIEQLINYIEKILNFNKKYTEIIKELKPLIETHI
jgi:hypothetical protein